MQTDKMFDVLVLGAGPAGAAAAVFSANKGLTVSVLERNAMLTPQAARLEWLHPQTHALLDRVGVTSQDAVLGTIDRVRFVDAARNRNATAPLDVTTDIVDTMRLTEDMLAAARAAGAELTCDAEVTSIETHEHAVTLNTRSGERVSGRFLIAADGYDSLAVKAFGFDQEQPPALPTSCCQSVCGTSVSPVVHHRRDAGATVIPAAAKPTGDGELTWILTSDDLSSFGYTYAVGGYVVIGFVAPIPTDDMSARFEEAIVQWRGAGILPEGVDARGARSEARRVPRGIALDADTHVAKRSLIIGDAGGYVTAASHEGLYPAIWSASLATEVCAEAKSARHPQDALAEFDARWRREMIEYLRLPNADLRFLIPLLFTNERMAQRLTNALLGGTNL